MGRRSLSTVSLVFCWIAVTAWVIVAVAGLLRLRRAVVGNRD
ncbi:putative membrane protein [Mycobacterium kansasii]|uniref:Putative membrane protein n=1 Tax=Mycobacterium kansasii TaxID=1768 RepID=A0A1V3WVN7_MYCKA|nr:putative membrane protein [Mycobacterium kansasii]